MRATSATSGVLWWCVLAAFALIECTWCDVTTTSSSSSSDQQQRACDQVNLQDQATALSVLNNGIDLVLKSGYLHRKLAALDPTTIRDEQLEPSDLKVLGVEYRVTTHVHAIQVSGVATAKPRHVNITSPSSGVVGADFNGMLRVNGTMHLTIEQLHRKWWQLCWTHFWSLSKCKPAEMDVDVDIAWLQPSIAVETRLVMLKCPHESNMPSGSKCSDLGITDLISAMLRRSVDKLEKRFLRRIKQLAVVNVDFAFDELSELDVRFHDSNSFTRSVMNTLAKFSKAQVNKKGFAYRTMTSFTDEYVNSTANVLIEDRIGAQFNATCYDA